MIEQLESDLREALADRAADVPSSAVTRLQRLDYQPRTRRVRPPVAIGALAGTAGAAAAVISIVGLGASASSAFAGWTPEPTQAPGAQTAKAEASCRERLAASPTPPGPTVPAAPTDVKPALIDTRGPFTVVIFAGPDGSESCIDGPSFTALSGSSGAGTSVPSGRIELTGVHFTSRDGHPYAIVEGHAGADVTGATLVLSDHTRVTASTDNGWFAAWWPGSQDVTAADVATTTGIVTENLTTHGPVQCGSGPCTRGAVSGQSAAVSGTVTTGGKAGGASGAGPVTMSLSNP